MKRLNIARPALIGLLGLGAVNAFAGAIGLIGGGIDIPLEMLQGTPFSSYVVPGLILGTIVGGSQLTGAAAVLRRTPRSLTVAALAGFIMMGWITGQVLLIGSEPGIMRNLQVACFTLGALEVALAALQVRAAEYAHE